MAGSTPSERGRSNSDLELAKAVLKLKDLSYKDWYETKRRQDEEIERIRRVLSTRAKQLSDLGLFPQERVLITPRDPQMEDVEGIRPLLKLQTLESRRGYEFQRGGYRFGASEWCLTPEGLLQKYHIGTKDGGSILSYSHSRPTSSEVIQLEEHALSAIISTIDRVANPLGFRDWRHSTRPREEAAAS